jgi:hypothetical protein
MKAKTSKSLLAPPRCQHFSPSGRQRCSPVAPQDAHLCARHAAAQPAAPVDFSAELVTPFGSFQRAQQINHSLLALYRLVAQGRISPRQGAVLAYIGSLVLRSLKAIDYDLARFDDDDDEANDDSQDQADTARKIESADESDDESNEDRDAGQSREYPAASPVGPGTEPLPATAEEFAAAALRLKSD